MLIACLFVSAAFACLRLPVLNPDRSFLALSSDNAIYALMAQDILTEGKSPIFFYGQHYQGPLTSIVIVGIQTIMNATGFKQIVPATASPYTICPFAISIASMVMTLGGLLCFSLFVRRIYGDGAAFIFAVLVFIGHSMLVMMSLRPLGAEMALLTGSWIALAFERWIRKRDRVSLFVAGMCTGIGLWMNEMTIFVLLPFVLWLVIQRVACIRIWKPIKIRDRFLLIGGAPRLRVLPNWIRVPGIFVHILLAINFAGGLIAVLLGGWNTIIFGIRMKVPNGLSPIKVSLFFFLLFQIAWWLASSEEARTASRRFFKKIWPGLTGFLVAYSPVWLGKLLGWYAQGYGVKFRIMAVCKIPAHVWDAIEFLPGLLLGSTRPLTVLSFWVVMLTLLVYCAIRLKKIKWSEWPNHVHSLGMIPWIMAAGNLLYTLLDDRVSKGFVQRYALFTYIGFCMTLSDAGQKFWRRPSLSPAIGITRKAAVILVFFFLGWHIMQMGKTQSGIFPLIQIQGRRFVSSFPLSAMSAMPIFGLLTNTSFLQTGGSSSYPIGLKIARRTEAVALLTCPARNALS